jgi:hypothetical protein
MPGKSGKREVGREKPRNMYPFSLHLSLFSSDRMPPCRP